MTTSTSTHRSRRFAKGDGLTTDRATTATSAQAFYFPVSRFAFSICTALVLTTLAYGTVHYCAGIIFAERRRPVCWCVDGFILRSVQLSRNTLQLPLLGLILPIHSAVAATTARKCGPFPLVTGNLSTCTPRGWCWSGHLAVHLFCRDACFH